MTTATLDRPQSSRALHVGLWAAQILLGLAFTMAGLMKLGTPHAELATAMNWVAHTPPLLVKLIGASELAGGLGLILPSATRIAPKLTPIAAALLLVVMILAAGFHLFLGEPQMIAPNVVLGSLAAFVAWGRWSKSPIAPR